MESKNVKNRTTFNVLCLIKKSKLLKNGEAPVFIRVTLNGQITDLSVQGSVLPDLWSQAKERSKGKDRSAMELNHYIESAKSHLFQIHRELEIDGKPITAAIIKDIYLGNQTESKEEGKTLGEAHSEHNERCRKLLGIEYSKSTIYKFDTSLSYLKQFIKQDFGTDDIALKKSMLNLSVAMNYF